jgi:hypothetical protein
MSDIYREGSEGASAHRDDLLRRRREELALLPPVVRRIVIARAARVGAAMAVTGLGAALIVLAAWPALAGGSANALPDHPALLTALLGMMWGGGVLGWWVARARAEQRFAAAMSRYVVPSGSVDYDLQRLDHERPADAARAMAHALDLRALVMPTIAATLLLPATAVYALALHAAGTWPPVSAIETGLGDAAAIMAALAAVAVAVVAVLGRIALRNVGLAVASQVVAMISFVAAVSAIGYHFDDAAVALFGVTGMTGALALAAYHSRNERIRLGDSKDVAPFVTYSTATPLGRGVARLCAAARRLPPALRGACVIGTIVGSVFALTKLAYHPERHGLANLDMPMYGGIEAGARPSLTKPNPPSSRRVVGDGSVEIRATVTDRDVVYVQLFDDLQIVPKGWHATLTVAANDPAVAVATDQAKGDAAWRTVPASLEIDACDRARKLELFVRDATAAMVVPSRVATLRVTVDLRTAPCP